MAYFRRYLNTLLFCTTLGFLPKLVAQSGVSAPTATIEFTVFASKPLTDVFFLPALGEQPLKLSFYSQSKSKIYSYKGQAQLRFFRPTTLVNQNRLSTEPPAVDLLATFSIPNGAKNLTLFFFDNATTNAGDSLPYIIYGVDDSAERLPRGHFNILNASGRIYTADMGNNRQESIGLGLSGPFAATSYTKLRLATQIGGDWFLSGSREFNFDVNTRGTLVFFPPEETGGISPNIRQLFEDLPSADKE